MMKRTQDYCGRFGSALLITGLVCACDASGSALTLATGGSQPVGQGGGQATGGNPTGSDVGGNSMVGGGSGGGAAGGAPATGGAKATGGAPTGGAPCVPGSQIGAKFSTNYAMLQYPQLSPYWVFNNGWSTSSTTLTTAGALQDVTALETCTPGVISWVTNYNWTGANNTVKGYPCAVLGWQKTKGFPVAASTSILPKAISSLTSVKCSWSFDVTGSAAQNISFDLWTHSGSCTASSIGGTAPPTDEIMIWLYASGGVNPIGYNGGGQQVSISGANWALSTGSGSDTYGSWGVHSFVRQGNVTSITDLDILAFLKNLNLGSKCLTSIEAGTEVFTGSGSLKTNTFSCTVQ